MYEYYCVIVTAIILSVALFLSYYLRKKQPEGDYKNNLLFCTILAIVCAILIPPLARTMVQKLNFPVFGAASFSLLIVISLAIAVFFIKVRIVDNKMQNTNTDDLSAEFADREDMAHPAGEIPEVSLQLSGSGYISSAGDAALEICAVRDEDIITDDVPAAASGIEEPGTGHASDEVFGSIPENETSQIIVQPDDVMVNSARYKEHSGSSEPGASEADISDPDAELTRYISAGTEAEAHAANDEPEAGMHASMTDIEHEAESETQIPYPDAELEKEIETDVELSVRNAADADKESLTLTKAIDKAMDNKIARNYSAAISFYERALAFDADREVMTLIVADLCSLYKKIDRRDLACALLDRTGEKLLNSEIKEIILENL